MKYSISVLIPTYNAGHFLRETLESVFAQRRLPLEIIVVDDGSTDETADIVRDIAPSAPVPLQLEVLPKNSGGPSLPTNRAIETAKGDFIALLDHDDLMLPDKLVLQASALESHPEIDLVLSDYQHFDSEGVLPESDARHREPLGHQALRIEDDGPVHIIDALRCLRAFTKRPGLALSCSSYFFRKSLWNRVGGFDHKFSPSADYDFLLRAIDRPVGWIDRPLFHKRVHDANHWRTFASDPSRRWAAERSLAQAQRAMLKRYPHDAILRGLVANHTGYVASGYMGSGEYGEALAEIIHLVRLRQSRQALRMFARLVIVLARKTQTRLFPWSARATQAAANSPLKSNEVSDSKLKAVKQP